MSNKAFVFDTNFIIQNHNLNDVVKNLNEKGLSCTLPSCNR